MRLVEAVRQRGGHLAWEILMGKVGTMGTKRIVVDVSEKPHNLDDTRCQTCGIGLDWCGLGCRQSYPFALESDPEGPIPYRCRDCANHHSNPSIFPAITERRDHLVYRDGLILAVAS